MPVADLTLQAIGGHVSPLVPPFTPGADAVPRMVLAALSMDTVPEPDPYLTLDVEHDV
jgi:hypothetical protein